MHYFGVVIVPPGITFDEASELATRRMAPYNEEVNGSGFYDWYQVGGRWTGVYSEYDPQKDARNIEVCTLCGGTGVRPGGLEQFGQDWFDGCNGCNGCRGQGTRLKWATHWARFEGDLCPVTYALNTRLPRTVVDADGAVGADWEVADDVNEKAVRAKLEECSDQWLLVVDYHS